MCNLNIKCKITDGSCDCCGEVPTFDHYLPIPVAFAGSSNISMILMLLSSVTQQNEAIKSISEQNAKSLVQIEQIEKLLEGKQNKDKPSEYLNSLPKLMELLCRGINDHQVHLQEVGQVPRPAYKDRAFSLLFQIVDSDGQAVLLKENETFTVELYSTEETPKLLKSNTNGENIISGVLEVEANSNILFRKIFIKEVSSHFCNSFYLLVVRAKKNPNIRPFVFEKFVVKARKLKLSEGPVKKAKIEEIDSFKVGTAD